jgi:stress-induced morphogen
MSTLEEEFRATAIKLAKANKEDDPETTEIFLFSDPQFINIRLVEVTNSIDDCGEILPFTFRPQLGSGINFAVTRIILSQGDWDSVLDGNLSLPPGWDFVEREVLIQDATFDLAATLRKQDLEKVGDSVSWITSILYENQFLFDAEIDFETLEDGRLGGFIVTDFFYDMDQAARHAFINDWLEDRLTPVEFALIRGFVTLTPEENNLNGKVSYGDLTVEQLEEVLRDHDDFVDADIDLEVSGSRINGFIVSESFAGMEQLDRQDLVFDYLEFKLSDEDLLHVGFLGTMTTAEVEDDWDYEAMENTENGLDDLDDAKEMPFKEDPAKQTEVEKEIKHVLNRYSQENASDTPDFILATYLLDCLAAWNKAVQRREEWYGRIKKSVIDGEFADVM